MQRACMQQSDLLLLSGPSSSCPTYAGSPCSAAYAANAAA